MKKRLIILLICLIAIGGVISYSVLNKPVESQVNSTPIVEKPKPPTVEELFKLTNEERAKAGVKPLKLDPRLNKSALQKVQDMYRYGYYAHDNPATGKNGTQFINEAGIQCRVGVGGENLAGGALSLDSSKKILDSWMASTPHKNATLAPDTDLVGFYVSSDYTVMHLCDIM